jgi:hypothetical protein
MQKLTEYTAETIESALRQIANRIPESTDLTLILLGSASLMLKHGLSRVTRDVDAFVRPRSAAPALGPLFDSYNLQIVSEMIPLLHPDFEDRLELIAEVNGIRITTLSAIDLIISKIGRGSRKDYEDILQSDILKTVNLTTLRAHYTEACQYTIGDLGRLITNFEVFEERMTTQCKRRNESR